ncbi:hypothetical protein F5Y16DRAFT_356313 [Xylariaceae sp. FL0255]|nr:hypothetical protein F5Y16DRAFT_356313 [Xylariaceae sp. FL0255]
MQTPALPCTQPARPANKKPISSTEYNPFLLVLLVGFHPVFSVYTPQRRYFVSYPSLLLFLFDLGRSLSCSPLEKQSIDRILYTTYIGRERSPRGAVQYDVCTPVTAAPIPEIPVAKTRCRFLSLGGKSTRGRGWNICHPLASPLILYICSASPSITQWHYHMPFILTIA